MVAIDTVAIDTVAIETVPLSKVSHMVTSAANEKVMWCYTATFLNELKHIL